jgi:putative RecB family exonuclease
MVEAVGAAVSDEPAQLGFDGMPRRLYSCTPSRLTTWLDCPRRYRMTYLDRPTPQKGPPWAHNSLGASAHNALANWWRLPREQRTPDAAGRLVERDWIAEGFRDDDQSALWRARARDMVTAYAERLDPYDEPVGVERTVATRTDVLALSGRVDRIDERPGDDEATELVIVDYKTGRTPLTDDDARGSLPLAVYAAAAARTLRRPCRTVELHHLPTGTVASHTYTEESLGRQLDRIEALALEAQAADARYDGLADIDAAFPPNPNRGCSWCDFRRHCPEGRAVSTDNQPWDGLAAD